jgi:predicted signal transduction protein with EAL and GGDEF domain
MSDESLIRAMPDLVTFVRPDGMITDHLGGRGLPFLSGAGVLAGRRIQELVEPVVAGLILRLIRRALANRDGCDAEFKMDGDAYLVRVHAQGPDRVTCVMRRVGNDRLAATGPHVQGHPEGFPGLLHDSVAEAGLRERPFALCVIFLGGLSDIGHLIDFSIRQRVLEAVIDRLRIVAGAGGDAPAIVDAMGDGLLGAIVAEGGNRDAIRSRVESIAASLSEPVHLNDAKFVLSPHIGVAIFGQDASSPQTLMNHARAAMLEARRSMAGSIQFYSDTVRMLPVVRLDIERELREAIKDGQIKLNYVGRHDLHSGRLSALHAHMRWVHPLRGEIPPAEFLPIAETTDLARAVSRAALERLALDLPQLRRHAGADLPICFGPLRHHLSSGHFLTDYFGSSLGDAMTSGRLELRIAERTLAAMTEPEPMLRELKDAGVQCVIDEIGSGASSLAQLAQLPISALQISRDLVVAAAHHPPAMRACRAIVALADALGVRSIAPGIDNAPSRVQMRELGCAQGFGDFYAQIDFTGHRQRESSAWDQDQSTAAVELR